MGGGAWLWRDDAIRPFTNAGYRVWTVSLTGHAGSRERKALADVTLDDHADDIIEAAERIGRPICVIGHSLGGAAAQLAIRKGFKPDRLILLASVPPYGMWRSTASMSWTQPGYLTALSHFAWTGRKDFQNHPELRKGLFPNGVDEGTFEWMGEHMDAAPPQALARSAGWPPFAPFPGKRDNLLVMGGMKDSLVPPSDQSATASYYGAQYLPIEGAGIC